MLPDASKRLVQLNVNRLVTISTNVPEEAQRYGSRAVAEAAADPESNHLEKQGVPTCCTNCGSPLLPGETMSQTLVPISDLPHSEKKLLRKMGRAHGGGVNGIYSINCTHCGDARNSKVKLPHPVVKKLKKRPPKERRKVVRKMTKPSSDSTLDRPSRSGGESGEIEEIITFDPKHELTEAPKEQSPQPTPSPPFTLSLTPQEELALPSPRRPRRKQPLHKAAAKSHAPKVRFFHNSR